MTQFDPGDHSASIASVTDRVRPVKIGVPVTSVHFLGERAAFVGAEENVFLVSGAPIAIARTLSVTETMEADSPGSNALITW